MPIDGETALGNSADDAERVEARAWLGGLLALSAVLQLVGTFARYATVPATASSADLPSSPEHSYSLYQGMHWGRPAFFVTLAITAAVAYLLTQHRDLYVAFASGFCAYNMATVALIVYVWSLTRGSSLGPGFYLLAASAATAAFVTIWMLRLLGPFPLHAGGLGSSRLALGVSAAVAVGLSTVIRDLGYFSLPLVIFDPLSLKSATAAAIGFIAVAAVPLVAVRVGGRVGSRVLVGLALAEAIRVFDAALRRFGNFRGIPFSAHLTIGWWIEIVAVVVLVMLARELRSRAPGQQTVPADAATT